MSVSIALRLFVSLTCGSAFASSSPRECASRLELRLIPELVEDVNLGLKTSTIRRGHLPEIVRGAAWFRVRESNLMVPIEIESVAFERTLDDVSDSTLRAQGPFVAAILETEGRPAALEAIARGMAEHYPGFERDHDVTVVNFRVIDP